MIVKCRVICNYKCFKVLFLLVRVFLYKKRFSAALRLWTVTLSLSPWFVTQKKTARIYGGKKRSNPCSQEFARPLFGGGGGAVFFCGTHDGIFERETTRSPATYGIWFFSVISVSLLTYLSRDSHRRTFLMDQTRSSELIPPQRQMKVNRWESNNRLLQMKNYFSVFQAI